MWNFISVDENWHMISFLNFILCLFSGVIFALFLHFFSLFILFISFVWLHYQISGWYYLQQSQLLFTFVIAALFITPHSPIDSQLLKLTLTPFTIHSLTKKNIFYMFHLDIFKINFMVISICYESCFSDLKMKIFHRRDFLQVN